MVEGKAGVQFTASWGGSGKGPGGCYKVGRIDAVNFLEWSYKPYTHTIHV